MREKHTETAIVYLHRSEQIDTNLNFNWFMEHGTTCEQDCYFGFSPELHERKKSDFDPKYTFVVDQKITDIRAFHDVINNGKFLDKYQNFIFITSKTRGPFLRPGKTICWPDKFIAHLVGDNVLCGPYLQFLPKSHPSLQLLDCEHISSDIISFISLDTFAISRKGFETLVAEKIFENSVYVCEQDRHINHDIPATLALFSKGLNVRCILQGYKYFDLKNNHDEIKLSAYHGNPTLLNSYFGQSASRYDLIFSKRLYDQPIRQKKQSLNTKLNCYTITYDESTRKNVRSGFLEIDNSKGPGAFREAYPILKFLSANSFDDDEWLGFFSPKLYEKTGVTYQDIKNIAIQAEKGTEVCLLTGQWESAAMWLNVWVQGEAYHHGLMDISQRLAKKAGYNKNLRSEVTCLNTAVFSNFFIAKPIFWREWSRVVQLYFNMVLNDNSLASYLVPYRQSLLPIHSFVLERVASMILINKNFNKQNDERVLHKKIPLDSVLGNNLITIDRYKNLFQKSKNPVWLECYKYEVHRYSENSKNLGDDGVASIYLHERYSH
ncbi:MAG: hypothetical protein VW124_16860 [Paracoccaceae bacterium]